MERRWKRSLGRAGAVALTGAILTIVTMVGWNWWVWFAEPDVDLRPFAEFEPRTPRTASAEVEPAPERRPHIILMSIDTLRADHLGCYGYERDTSDSIDRFAGEAVLFERAISQAPYTAAAHMSLFTGFTPAVHGVFNYDGIGPPTALAPGIRTLAEILTEHGYRSIGIHGGANVSDTLGFGRGFERYVQGRRWFDLRKGGRALEPVRKELRDSKRDGVPLFLFLHHYLCHDPYVQVPNHDRFRYLPEPVEGLPVEWEDTLVDGKMSPKRFWRDVDLDDPRHLDHVVSLYDGCIHYSDFIFGRVEAMLREEQLYEDAFVILVSDHGDEFNEHGGHGHWKLFDETLHVPLIVKFPGGLHAAKRIARPVRSFDLMPTLLEVLGIEAPDPMQAVSLMPLLTGSGDYDPLIVSNARQRPDIATRFQRGGWTYSDQQFRGCFEWLFETRRDLAEQDNLAPYRPRLLEALRAMTASLRTADERFIDHLGAGEGEAFVPDGQMLEQLRALGYVK